MAQIESRRALSSEVAELQAFMQDDSPVQCHTYIFCPKKLWFIRTEAGAEYRVTGEAARFVYGGIPQFFDAVRARRERIGARTNA